MLNRPRFIVDFSSIRRTFISVVAGGARQEFDPHWTRGAGDQRPISSWRKELLTWFGILRSEKDDGVHKRQEAAS